MPTENYWSLREKGIAGLDYLNELLLPRLQESAFGDGHLGVEIGDLVVADKDSALLDHALRLPTEHRSVNFTSLL